MQFIYKEVLTTNKYGRIKKKGEGVGGVCKLQVKNSKKSNSLFYFD